MTTISGFLAAFLAPALVFCWLPANAASFREQRNVTATASANSNSRSAVIFWELLELSHRPLLLGWTGNWTLDFHLRRVRMH